VFFPVSTVVSVITERRTVIMNSGNSEANYRWYVENKNISLYLDDMIVLGTEKPWQVGLLKSGSAT